MPRLRGRRWVGAEEHSDPSARKGLRAAGITGLQDTEGPMRIRWGGEKGHRAESLFSRVNKFRLYFKFMKKLLKGFKYERA